MVCEVKDELPGEWQGLRGNDDDDVSITSDGWVDNCARSHSC